MHGACNTHYFGKGDDDNNESDKDDYNCDDDDECAYNFQIPGVN